MFGQSKAQTLDQLAQQLQLSTFETKQINQKTDELRDYLFSLENDFLIKLLSQPALYLSGSVLKGTSISPIDHFNLFLSLKTPDLTYNPTDDVVTISNSTSPFTNFSNQSNLISSQLILGKIAQILGPKFNCLVTDNNVSLLLSDNRSPIKIKLTPILSFFDSNLIPDENSYLHFRKIDLNAEQSTIDYLDNQNQQQLKKAIRIIKFWNRQKNGSQLRSLHIEAICCLALSAINFKINSLQELTKEIMTILPRFLYNAPDPFGTYSQLISYLPDSVDYWYLLMNRISEFKNYLLQSQKAAVKFLQT